LPHAAPSADGELVEETAPDDLEDARESSRLLPIVFISALLLVLILCSIPLLLILKARRDKDRAENDDVARKAEEPLDPEAAAADITWTDASAKSLMLNGIKVHVESAEWDAVQDRGAGGQPVTTGDHYLVVSLTITNRTARRARYRSWSNRPYRAKLTDDSGRSYAQTEFTALSPDTVQVVRRHLQPRQEAGELLVFLIPSGVNHHGIQHFRLALPADAIGEDSMFYFEIPRHMVAGL